MREGRWAHVWMGGKRQQNNAKRQSGERNEERWMKSQREGGGG